ncbi:MAG: SOS response-associated peptidase [Rhodobacteraceae bacterium]|nr:MAG: SOS response-associated peptidase [Paracoccaceae bacterium]
MCGRFAITLPNDAMARAFAARPANDLPEVPRYNICPTQPIAVVTSRDGRRHVGPMRWGFLPRWYKTAADGPLLINARAETIAQKPAFAEAARQRRCLIPASGFYEWTKDTEGQRLPWFIASRTDEMLAFAGIWQDWIQGDQRHVTCAIVTCAANDAMAQIHHRMPVIVAPEDWSLWLGEAGHGAAGLMRAAPEGALRWHRVDRRVNSNRAEGAALIAPLG